MSAERLNTGSFYAIIHLKISLDCHYCILKQQQISHHNNKVTSVAEAVFQSIIQTSIARSSFLDHTIDTIYGPTKTMTTMMNRALLHHTVPQQQNFRSSMINDLVGKEFTQLWNAFIFATVFIYLFYLHVLYVFFLIPQQPTNTVYY